MLWSALLDPLAQAQAQLFRSLRPGKEPLEQRPQIQSCSSTDDGELPANGDLLHNRASLAGIFARTDIAKRIDAVEEMMRDFGTLTPRWLRGTDIEVTVHRYRITVDDFSPETPSEGQGQRGLPACCGTQNNGKQRRAAEFLSLLLQRIR